MNFGINLYEFHYIFVDKYQHTFLSKFNVRL